MRNSLLWTLVSFVALFSIIACDQNLSQSPFTINTDTDKKWEQQLHSVMEYKTRTSFDSLIFVNYREIGEITSVRKLEDAVNAIFAADVYMAIQNPNDYSFVITPIKEVAYLTGNFAELKNEIITEVSSYLLDRMTIRLLELEWTFKGHTCFSRALVSDEEGVLFETIGHLIISENDNLSINTIKTRNETANDNLDGNPFKRTFTKKNLWTTVVSCSVYCQSYFSSAGVLKDMDMDYNSTSKLGYSSSADIKTIAGEIDKDSYHKFAWAYAYKHGTGLTISWNGTGFTISGGDFSNGGTEVHRN